MPRARARARKAATHCSNDAWLACARAVVLHAATVAPSMDRQARLDRGGFIHSLIARDPGNRCPGRRLYSRFCRLCGRLAKIGAVAAERVDDGYWAVGFDSQAIGRPPPLK